MASILQAEGLFGVYRSKSFEVVGQRYKAALTSVPTGIAALTFVRWRGFSTSETM